MERFVGILGIFAALKLSKSTLYVRVCLAHFPIVLVKQLKRFVDYVVW